MTALVRFNQEDLPGIIQNRITNSDDGRPLAVVIYPSSDWNGAFFNTPNVMHQLISEGYRVMYYEANTDTEAEVFLQQATNNGQSPAQVLIVGGHGSQGSLRIRQYGGTGSDDHTCFLFLGQRTFLRPLNRLIL